MSFLPFPFTGCLRQVDLVWDGHCNFREKNTKVKPPFAASFKFWFQMSILIIIVDWPVLNIHPISEATFTLFYWLLKTCLNVHEATIVITVRKKVTRIKQSLPFKCSFYFFPFTGGLRQIWLCMRQALQVQEENSNMKPAFRYVSFKCWFQKLILNIVRWPVFNRNLSSKGHLYEATIVITRRKIQRRSPLCGMPTATISLSEKN